MSQYLRSMALAAAAAAALAGGAYADVFVTSPSTGRVLALDSNGAVVRTFGEAGGLREPYGIVLDASRNLLVADYAAGRIVRYAADSGNASVVATGIRKPDGLSTGPAGEIFLVSRDDAAASGRLRTADGSDATALYLNHVWTIPAGGGLPALIGRVEESSRLAQTAPLASGPFRGDLLVLSTRPGVLARFNRTTAGGWTRAADFAAGIPAEPTGLAILRAGTVLVATSDGRILKYSSAGQRLYPDFAKGLAAGPMRLSVMMDGIVHATRVGGSVVHRFDSHGLRLADLGSGLSPVASALNAACVPTPVGSHVAVSPAAGVQAIFDFVTQAGQTCLTTTTLPPGSRLTPAGNQIPGYALKLWEDPGFVVYEVTTTALYTDSIGLEFYAENPDARLAHAHGTGSIFEDVTTLVTPNDPRGRIPSLSEFVIYLDTRSAQEVTLLKLDRLRDVLAASEPLITSPDLFDTLDARLQEIAEAIGSGGPDRDQEEAIGLLLEFKALVRQASGIGLPNTPIPAPPNNVSGSLLAWADTLIFHLTL